MPKCRIGPVTEPTARGPRGRGDSREATELKAIKVRQPELADAVDMHLALLEIERRIQGRIPLPWFELTAEVITRHQASGRPLLRFEDIPLELTDLRLTVRQTAEVLRQFGELDDDDFQKVQALGRDMTLLAVAGQWYRAAAETHVAAVGVPAAADQPVDIGVFEQVLALAMRPFLSRCAEVVQPRPDLSVWTHSYCPMCGADPDFSVITPAAERHLICSRCTLRWKFEPLTCPFCRNSDRTRITSFARPDGQYRVYGCDVCRRYLKAYDARRAARPVMPVVDGVATLPLDAAAMQRGYSA
jgi:hypothetical protein